MRKLMLLRLAPTVASAFSIPVLLLAILFSLASCGASEVGVGADPEALTGCGHIGEPCCHLKPGCLAGGLCESNVCNSIGCGHVGELCCSGVPACFPPATLCGTHNFPNGPWTCMVP